MKIEIRRRTDGEIILCGEYESIKDCLEKNRGADLRGAHLGGAYLRGAYLRGAYLRGAREYVNSHDFLIAVIHQQKVETFTTEEWACIGQIYIHTLCWNSIHKRFKKEAMSIFEKLEKIGFGEWLVKFKEEI